MMPWRLFAGFALMLAACLGTPLAARAADRPAG